MSSARVQRERQAAAIEATGGRKVSELTISDAVLMAAVLGCRNAAASHTSTKAVALARDVLRTEFPGRADVPLGQMTFGDILLIASLAASRVDTTEAPSAARARTIAGTVLAALVNTGDNHD